MKETGTILGILGGLGPMASVYFYQLITEHTSAQCDQDHIDILLSSKATTPDRTAFIVGDSNEDPFAVMEREAQKLVRAGVGVLAVSCNTAHYFHKRLEKAVSVPVLNMVELTVEALCAGGCQKAGILATDGTVNTGIYQRMCEEKGLSWQVPEPEGQRRVMEIIYSIKAGKTPEGFALQEVADTLFASGCQKMVLGCTELSLIKRAGLLDARYVDSMEVLAKAAIEFCGKTPRGFENAF